jgi:hypothetical protein
MDQTKLAKGAKEKKINPPKLRTIYNWIKRNKKLHLRKVSMVEAARIRASTKQNIRSFFDVYEHDNDINNYRKELIVFFFIFLHIIFFNSIISMSLPL